MSEENKETVKLKEELEKAVNYGVELTNDNLKLVVGGLPEVGNVNKHQEWWKPVQLIDSCGNWELRPYTSGEGIAQSQGEPRKVCATCNHFGFCDDETYCTFKC